MDFEPLNTQNNAIQPSDALSEAMEKARKVAYKYINDFF